MEPGPLNAITDVAGVRVGHTTVISGDGPLRVLMTATSGRSLSSPGRIGSTETAS